LDREIKIRKKFGFFYSYPTYKEVCKAANPFTSLDYTEYLSPDDIMWLSGYKIAETSSDSAILEKADEKAEDFIKKAVLIEVEEVLKNGLAQLDDPRLNPDDVILYEDSLEVEIDEWDFDSLADLIDSYAEWTKQPEVLSLKNIKPPIFETLDRDSELLTNIYFMDAYTQMVQMPGLVIETNSPSINGNTVKWNVDVHSFLFKDLELYVVSRVINIWAFILAGLVFLGFIGLLIYRSFK